MLLIFRLIEYRYGKLNLKEALIRSSIFNGYAHIYLIFSQKVEIMNKLHGSKVAQKYVSNTISKTEVNLLGARANQK